MEKDKISSFEKKINNCIFLMIVVRDFQPPQWTLGLKVYAYLTLGH